MARLCERPGCGETASVSYGFDAERAMVWLEALGPNGPTSGVLCRRHADAIVLPKGWWLHDRRSDTTLFTATAATPVHTYRPKRPRRRPAVSSPLPLEPVAAEAVEEPPVPAWTPTFDAGSDLGGLLDAKTPLLSRAFGQPRPAAPSER